MHWPAVLSFKYVNLKRLVLPEPLQNSPARHLDALALKLSFGLCERIPFLVQRDGIPDFFFRKPHPEEMVSWSELPPTLFAQSKSLLALLIIAVASEHKHA